MIAVLTALHLACAAGPACAEQELSARDSQAVLRAARSAQERFERTRRTHLSVGDGGPADHCDERIGSHCFTYGDPEDAWKPPKETREVTTGRDSLLALLQRGAASLPGDRWIAGQRVRYLVEASRLGEAAGAAADCASVEAWWCFALQGYVSHAAEDYIAAEAAFDEALRTMDDVQRCSWRDITLLIPGAPSQAYQRLGCETREPMERRFWWIADPLFLTPGNERRSEHFARHVYAQFERDAPSVSPTAWQDEFRPWLVRYGPPAGWQKQRSYSMTPDVDPQIVTHYRGPVHVFEPGWSALDSIETLTPEALPLRPQDARTGYVPSYSERFDTLRYQVALFRRGGSVTLVGAYDISADSVPATAQALAGLFVKPNDHERGATAQVQQQAVGVVTLKAPARAGLVSLEAMSLDGRGAGRARYWLPIPPLASGALATSDILLLSGQASLPATLEDATPRTRPGVTAYRGETVGLFWEIYGAAPGSAPVTISVTLVKESSGWLRRTARSLGLGSRERPAVSLEWTATPRPDGGPMAEAIALDLGQNGPGRYTLNVDVASEGLASATASREIFITEGGNR